MLANQFQLTEPRILKELEGFRPVLMRRRLADFLAHGFLPVLILRLLLVQGEPRDFGFTPQALSVLGSRSLPSLGACHPRAFSFSQISTLVSTGSPGQSLALRRI